MFGGGRRVASRLKPIQIHFFEDGLLRSGCLSRGWLGRVGKRGAVGQGSGAETRVVFLPVQPRVQFLYPGLQFGNFVVEDASTIRNWIMLFSKPGHGRRPGQRRNSITARSVRAMRATAAKGQVNARPIRQSSPKLWVDSKAEVAEVGVAGDLAVSTFAGWPESTENFRRAVFHSMRAFSRVVSARVSSTLRLSAVQLSSRIA